MADLSDDESVAKMGYPDLDVGHPASGPSTMLRLSGDRVAAATRREAEASLYLAAKSRGKGKDNGKSRSSAFGEG